MSKHPHASTGWDFALRQQGIRVFRLRPGRQFTKEQRERITPRVIKWLARSLDTMVVMGMRPLLDRESLRLWHDIKHDVLVVAFDVTVGWDEAFECYANQSMAHESMPIEGVEVMTMSELLDRIELGGIVH